MTNPAHRLTKVWHVVSALLVVPICAGALEPLVVMAARSFYTSEASGQFILHGLADSLYTDDVQAELYVGEELLARVSPVLGRRVTVSFPLAGLPQGDSDISCRLLASERELAHANASVRRLPPKPNAVKLDRISGGLIVDDLPFFPFGFYCYSPVQPTLAEEEIVRGFNLMSPYQSNEPEGREERRAYMDRAAELGMKVHYQLLRVAGGGGVMGADSSDARQKGDWLRAEVEAFRDHPALLAWYISDEPTGNNMPPENLERSYRIVRELDPYHPVTIVFMAPHRADEYAAGMDVVMTDPYPIPHNPPASVSDAVRAVTDVFEPAKPVWLVPQAFGGNEWWTREPTAQEQRVMTFLGIVDGATGIQYFIRHGLSGFPKSPIMWAACSRAALEVGALTPALLSHEARPAVSSSLTSVRVAAWRHRGVITVLAVNTENRPHTLQVAVENVEFSGEADVLFEDRTLQVTSVPARSQTPLSTLLLPAALLTRPFRGPDLSAIWPRAIIDDIIDAYGTRIYRLRVGPAAADRAVPSPRNLVLDPSFEWSPSPGSPAAVYASVAEERGATYFVDPRVAVHGDQSLRLHTPRAGQGVTIGPFAPTVSQGRAYRLDVWAKASSAGPEPVLKLGIGNAVGTAEALYELSSDWRQYSLDGTMEPGATRASLSVSLETPGTAWVDLLQLYDISPRISSQAMPSGGFTVVLENYLSDARLRYTLDGTEPAVDSPLYTRPFHVGRTSTVKCAVFVNGTALSSSALSLHRHAGIGRFLGLTHPYSERYTAGGQGALNDGVFGSTYFNDGHWQGFEEVDMEAVIDLERQVPISRVAVHFLQNVTSWIFLPTRVSFYGSSDGEDFVLLSAVENSVPEDRQGSFIQEVTARVDGQRYRYVRVHAESMGVCPPWHAGAGGMAWIFADEIHIVAGES